MARPMKITRLLPKTRREKLAIRSFRATLIPRWLETLVRCQVTNVEQLSLAGGGIHQTFMELMQRDANVFYFWCVTFVSIAATRIKVYAYASICVRKLFDRTCVAGGVREARFIH